MPGKKNNDESGAAPTPNPLETAGSPVPGYVVGIGASAGGFEALELFFDAMPSDSGIAFAVVQHLSPDHKSLMVELLSRHTGMKVLQAEDGMPLEANTVFLIPPRKVMTVSQGRLRLADKADRPLPSFPIDIFFNSLAESLGDRAAGVILSGTGSDGTRGIRALKEEGGLIMVQDPASAKFDGMPRNAIATGLADYVLSPEQMPVELMKYVSHPFARAERDAKIAEPGDENKLARIFTLLKNHSGVDFTFYKQSTVLRRIERRLSINQLESLDSYVKYLYANPDESGILYKDLLIGVTRFFRDAEAFDQIKTRILPELFKSRKGPLRAWVCGCSTGEEAYSLAIVFKEYMDETGDQREVKIFATDIDKEALEFASNGLYPENIVADLTPERFRNFFIKSGDKYRVAKGVREMVIFALQNIIKDPPFNKIDLLTCRNMLIYLQPVLQQKVLAFFNFALNEGGFLVLGSSETVGAYTNLFAPFDTKWKIYRCRGKHLPLPAEGFSISSVRPRRAPSLGAGSSPLVQTSRERVIGGILEELMDRYVPPTLIVNQDNEVVHIRGDVSRFVSLRPGKTSLGLSNLVRKDLSIALETGVNKAMRENQQAVYKDIRLKDPSGELRIDLSVIPYVDDRSGEKLAATVFHEQAGEPDCELAGEPFDLDSKARQRITDLEAELQYNRENLQATIEEVETTNEELQATNEELLSANEELQSTNEELQSVNEELITVNAEYQSKIAELTELNNDMTNLLSSTNIGVIFLDRDLAVRKFTPAIREEVNLMDFDIGRPIAHISLNIHYDSLVEDARKVLAHLSPIQKEVVSNAGKTLLMRMLPYVTLDNVVKGVVITFVDITGVKSAETTLRKFSQAVEASPSMVLLTDPAGRVEYANRSFLKNTGFSPEEIQGMDIAGLTAGELSGQSFKDLWKALGAGKTWSGRLSTLRKDGSVYEEEASLLPVLGESGEIINYLKLSTDITGRLEDGRKLASQQTLLDQLEDRHAAAGKAADSLDSREDIIVTLGGDLRVEYANRKALAVLGLTQEKAQGLDWIERFVPGEARKDQRQALEALLAGQGQPSRRYRLDLPTRDGSINLEWVDKVLRDESGAVSGIMLIGSASQ